MVKLNDKEVGNIGYGLMGFTWRANPTQPTEAHKAMKAALAAGNFFWNGGVFYGPDGGYNSNVLLKSYFEAYPEDKDKVIISIKGGVKPGTFDIDGTEEGIFAAIDRTNQQLGGAKFLDLYEMARVDQKTPVEITMRAFKKKIDAGELGGVCLSEASEDTIRRAHKILPIQGVEVEFSLFETSILENGVAKACAELNIPVVAYSPLGRGFLTGQIRSRADIPEDDMRRSFPRFSEENFPSNLKIVLEVEEMAKRKGTTTGQIAIGWILAKSGKDGYPVMIPIPGSTTKERVEENANPASLTSDEVKQIDEMLQRTTVKGSRYPEHYMAAVYGSTPKLA